MIAKSMQGSYYGLQGCTNRGSIMNVGAIVNIASAVDCTSGRTNGRGKHTKNGLNTSTIPVSCILRATVLLQSYWWLWVAYGARDWEQKTTHDLMVLSQSRKIRVVCCVREHWQK